jgi:hypothetical protein
MPDTLTRCERSAFGSIARFALTVWTGDLLLSALDGDYGAAEGAGAMLCAVLVLWQILGIVLDAAGRRRERDRDEG